MPIRRASAPLPSPATLLRGGASSGGHMETPSPAPSPALSLPPLPSSPFSSPPLLPLPHLLQWNPSYSPSLPHAPCPSPAPRFPPLPSSPISYPLLQLNLSYSSSSLSALVPPFTLDHASSALHPSLQMPPCTRDPLLFFGAPSSAPVPPHNEVAESLPSPSDSCPQGDSDFPDCFRNAELHPELQVKALGNTFEPTISSRFTAPSGAGSDAASVETVYSLDYPDSQQWNFGPESAYYNHRTSLLIDGKVSPAKRSDEVPLTEVTRPPFSYKALSFLEDHPSSSQLLPHNTTADSLPSRSINAPFGHPCYAPYCNGSELRALDDNFGPSLAHSKLGATHPWSKPSNEDGGSVKLPDELPGTGPPSSNRKLFFPGEKEHFGYPSTEWLLDDYPPEKYEREQDSASSYTMFNPQLPTSAMGLNDTSAYDRYMSAYDHYMAQLDTWSVYPALHYPFAKWSASNEVYLPSKFTASANINPSLSSGKVHHEVLHMVDDASFIPSRSEEANLNENMDPKGEYNKRWEDYNKTNSNVIPAVSRRDSLSSSNHATESPLNLPSMLTSKLRLGNMVIPDSSPSGCNSLDLNISSMCSSEALDQHNLSVDSPCWKGAPASQLSQFTSDKMLFVERELIKNHSCHEPNQIFEGVGDPNNSAELVVNLNFDYTKKSYVSEKPEYSPVDSSNMQQILEFSENKMSDCRKDQENDISFDYVHGEQTNQTTEAKKRQHVFAAKFVEMESNAPNEFPPPKGIAKNIKDPSSTPLRKLEDLVKLIHGSSVELLSTNCSDAEGLKPHDCKLLYAAISNISLLLKDEDVVGSCHCSGLAVACSENMSSRNQNYDMKQKTISGYDYFDDDFGNLVIQEGDAYVSKGDKKMIQTLENLLSQSSTESEEGKQASLYRKLWVQAQLLACKLKEELVIARTKIESESYKPPQSDMPSSLNSLQNLKDTDNIREKESQFSASTNHGLSKAEDVESSVMARYEILKDRYNKSIHRDVELEYILDQEHAAMHPVVNTNMYSSPDAESNSSMTANLFDTRFIAAVVDDQVSPSVDVSAYANTRPMLLGPLNVPLIQSYMTNQQGSCPKRSGDEDLSFEWVHVMEEDESTQ